MRIREHYDIAIGSDEIIKGEGSTNVELVWPRKLPAYVLSAALPRGARAIVLRDGPDGDAGAH